MRSGHRSLPYGLALLYEDSDLLVVNKPAGLLTVATSRDRARTVHEILTDYVRKGCAKSTKKVFAVHRLDKQTSGVLVFAKSEQVRERIQAQWGQTRKIYWAVVHGTLSTKAGTISTYLAENSAHVVYSTTDPARGKLSHTAYRVLREAKGFSVLEVDLLTGRKNQIRVHLAGIGHPVVGDRKYGQEQAKAHLGLHALSISFRHPTKGEGLAFTAEPPAYFKKWIRFVPKCPPCRQVIAGDS